MKNNWILIKLNILDFMKIKNLQNNKNNLHFCCLRPSILRGVLDGLPSMVFFHADTLKPNSSRKHLKS